MKPSFFSLRMFCLELAMLISLTSLGVEPDLALAALEHRGGEPLLEEKAD